MPALNDPIAAVATPPGRGAVAILRISGSNLTQITNKLIGDIPTPRLATFRKIIGTQKEIIDDAIVIYFEGPRSFTGEDVLEIQTHGGTVVIREALRAAIAAGARQADAGEFSERAFLNGKMDLIQAEAIADLIESSTTHAARLAHNSLSGEFSRKVNEITEKLKSIHVQIEAFIDFPEDELPAHTLQALTNRTKEIDEALTKLIVESERGAKIKAGLNIAIVGRPNVGKSTLLNVLAGDERAIVTDEPGTTRDVVTIDTEIGGLLVRFHDTAGLRDAENMIEKEGVRRAKQLIEQSDAIFHVVTTDADELNEFVGNLTVPVFKIRNKIDLDQLAVDLQENRNGARIQISAKHVQGIDLLHRALLNCFDIAGDANDTFLARERHLEGLNTAKDALDYDHIALYRNSPELAAEQLRQAVRALGSLTGAYSNEELLGDIFSTFCIGK